MTLTSILVLILISIAIGFLIGALVYGLRGKPSQQPGEEENLPAEQGVRLWRDPQTQKLSVVVDGKTYQQAGELMPETRSRLARLARDWQLWLGMPLSRLTALAAPSSPEFAEPPVETNNKPDSTVQPSTGKAPAKPVRGAEKTKPEAAPESIAAQIDEILQTRIENTPLAERGIKLQEIPGQGLVVMVGDEKYTDLTLVPDQNVRGAIAAAVAEWEKKNAPGIRG
jgi:hypothetical protein